jgi:hypothetical protein
MARKHWLLEIGEAVRERAYEAVDDIAASLKDSVPFGYPPPQPPKMDLQTYLAAPPDMRQAFLQGLPADEFSSTMSDLQNEAVSKFGPMAQAIMPMLTMEETAGQVGHLEQQDPSAGLVAAHAELTELLGMDPFS